jgi:hypothetical protein
MNRYGMMRMFHVKQRTPLISSANWTAKMRLARRSAVSLFEPAGINERSKPNDLFLLGF